MSGHFNAGNPAITSGLLDLGSRLALADAVQAVADGRMASARVVLTELTDARLDDARVVLARVLGLVNQIQDRRRT